MSLLFKDQRIGQRQDDRRWISDDRCWKHEEMHEDRGLKCLCALFLYLNAIFSGACFI